MNCPACGTAIATDSRFCGQCGHVLERRIPTTVDEATRDPEPPAPVAKPTMVGSADLNKTVLAPSSTERILAGLEWNAPPSEPAPKAPAAPETSPGVATLDPERTRRLAAHEIPDMRESAVPTAPVPRASPSPCPTRKT